MARSASIIDIDRQKHVVTFHVGDHWKDVPGATLRSHLIKLATQVADDLDRLPLDAVKQSELPQRLVDILWPGVRSWKGKGVPVEDFYVRNGGLFLRLTDGSGHVIATPEEIASDEYKELFNPRMAALVQRKAEAS